METRVGIDIQIPFVATYGFYQGKVLSSLNILQQLGRGRKVKKFYISMHNYFRSGCKYFGQTYGEIDTLIKKELSCDFRTEKDMLYEMAIEDKEDADKSKFYPIYVRQKLYENYISKYLIEFLSKLLHSQGFETRIHLNTQLDEKMEIFKDEIKFISSMSGSIKDEYMKLIDNILNEENEIMEKIFIKTDITKELKEKTMKKIEYLGIEKYEELPLKIREVLYDENKYQDLIKKIQFTYSKEEIEKKIKLDKEKTLIEKNKILTKLELMYEIEEELEIKRLEFDKINNGIDKNLRRNIKKQIERTHSEEKIKEIYEKFENSMYKKDIKYLEKTYPEFKNQIKNNLKKMVKLSNNKIERIIINYEIFNNNKEHKERLWRLNKERRMQDLVYSLYKDFLGEMLTKSYHKKIEIKGMEEIIELKMRINDWEINENLIKKYGEKKTIYHTFYNKKESKIREISKLEDFEYENHS